MAQVPGISHARIFDALHQLKDTSAAVTTSAGAQVGGAAKIVDLGADAEMWATVVIDVTAIDVVTGDEAYILMVQGSNVAAFTSDIVPLGECRLGGAAGQAAGIDVVSTVGRYLLPFTNWRDGIPYRYLRMFHLIAGTTPSITYTAFMSKL